MPLEHNGLVKLAEECGELVQAAMKKIARSDGEDVHWDGSNLKERIADEIADVRAASEVVERLYSLDRRRIKARSMKKVALFEYWHEGGTETTLPLEWCHQCGGDADVYDNCETCANTGMLAREFDPDTDVEKQEEIVSTLYAFGRLMGCSDLNIRKSITPALSDILGQFDLRVAEIQ